MGIDCAEANNCGVKTELSKEMHGHKLGSSFMELMAHKPVSQNL